MNPESIDRLIAKNPKLRNKRQKLEQLHDGAYCMHGSWGFGRIVSYDEASKKLIIDFEGKPGHKMDPVFCVDKLEVLDDDNLLVRYRTDRENLENLWSPTSRKNRICRQARLSSKLYSNSSSGM